MVRAKQAGGVTGVPTLGFRKGKTWAARGGNPPPPP